MLPGKEYKPMDYASMAWRRRWVIISLFLMGTYATLIVSSRLPNMYRSEMLIQVVPQRVPDAYVKSTVTMKTVDRLSALSEQIMSRTELERMITQMNLYADERTRFPLQDVIEVMRSQIKVEPVRAGNQDADSFYVRFAYPDATTAMRVTERLGGLFIDVNARDRGNLAQATNSFLQTQLEEARTRLEQTEERLRRFREQNSGRLPTQLQFNMQAMQNAQMRIQALVESLARDRDRKLMLERLYADVQAEVIVPVTPPPQPAQQPQQAQGSTTQPNAAATTGNTRLTLEVARQTLVGFETRLKPEHPDVQRTKQLIAKLEAQLAEEEKKAAEAAAAGTPVEAPVVTNPQELARRDRLQQMRADIESTARQITFRESEEQRARDALENLQHRIEQVPGVESEWIALSRDYDTQQAAYKELLTKSEDAKLAANLEQRQIGEQFRILDAPRVPGKPTGVNRLEVNGIGAAISFALGLLLAAILELRDRTFRHADDIVDVFKLPVIALVPQVVTPADLQRARMRRRLVSVATILVVLAGGYGFWAMQLWKYIA